MEHKRTDISQIRKYLNGELDSNAMHRLEREAQHDPFLMDALEGFEKAGKHEQTNLDQLQQKLQQRINKKEARVIPLWYWSAAASVLLVMGIGGLWYKSTTTIVKPGRFAQADKTVTAIPETPKAPVIRPEANKTVTPATPAIVYDAKKPAPLIKNDIKVAKPQNMPVAPYDRLAANNLPAKKDTMELNEVVVLGYGNARKKEVTYSMSTVAPIDSGKALQLALRGKAAGVEVNRNYGFERATQAVTGIVIGKDDGLPVVGASVTIQGTNLGAQTNVNGRFTLNNAKGKTLNIAAIGYQTRQVAVKGKDSLKIVLDINTTALAEVAIGYGKRKDIDEHPSGAHPKQGWDSFKKYLEDYAITARGGKKGKVKLEFMVAADGSISDIKVIRSLDATSDAKAIELIKNGPAWLGNTNQKPEKIRVKVKFH